MKNRSSESVRGTAKARTFAPHDNVDEASEDSFPASDAPGFSGMRIGPPKTPRPPRASASP